MRILFVSTHVPTQRWLRPYQLIRTLAARGHEVSLVCAAGADDQPRLAALQKICRRVSAVTLPAGARLRNTARALAGDLPLVATATFAEPLLEAIQREVRSGSYDVAHVDGLAAAPLGYALATLPAVLDAASCAGAQLQGAQQANLLQRATAVIGLARARRYEAAYGAQYERIVAASPDDAWGLRCLAAELGSAEAPQIHVVPNGVDLDYFTPHPVERRAATIVLSGRMASLEDERAALFMARTVMPWVWRVRSDARLTIVGEQPSRAVAALAADPRIYVSGAVNDLRQHLARATLAVVPWPAGGGVPNRLLEALAMGTPVLADRAIARSLPVDDGHSMVLADSPAEYAQAIMALIDDPRWRGQLGRAGRQLAEERGSWHTTAAEFEQIYAAARGVEIAAWRLEMGLSQRQLAR